MPQMFGKVAYAISIGGTAVTLALRVLGADDTLTFGVAALTILGLAYTLGHATEQLGLAAGPRIGGIMNATVGNIGEIIIAGFLIADNKIEIVHASITGSIVGNLLLVLGASLLVGGLKNGIQSYDSQATGMNAASLILATIGLVVPATFAFLIGGGETTAPGDPAFFRVEALTVGVASPAADHLRGADLVLPPLAGVTDRGPRPGGRAAVELEAGARHPAGIGGGAHLRQRGAGPHARAGGRLARHQRVLHRHHPDPADRQPRGARGRV